MSKEYTSEQALKALERMLDNSVTIFDLDEYYTLGDFADVGELEIIKNVLERGKPKKPIKVEKNHYVCPSCKETVFIFDEDILWKNSFIWNENFNKYCKCCGQKLDWHLEGEIK